MTETIPYKVIEELDGVELRSYPAIRVATVRSAHGDEGFRHLFAYISGENRARRNISMTAPVISEKIAMTAPVLSDEATMSFVMPEEYSLQDLPEPLDPKVRLSEIPPREVALIRFRGTADAEAVSEMAGQLLAVLAQHGIEAVGIPFLMRYNPPFIPGIFRRNEVAVEIRR
ncbi:MAG: heme-binding protein [Methanomicrobiaceae archaeon]|nr:heme-binding protein [Methanomicrobiaceae archaeon]